MILDGERSFNRLRYKVRYTAFMENRSSLWHHLGVVLVLLAKYECYNFLCIIVLLDFHCTDLIEYIIIT